MLQRQSPGWKRAAAKLFTFGYEQAMSCLFPVYMFISIAVTKWIDIPFLHGYDFIFIMAILGQWLMLQLRLETKDELKVIFVFHLVGLCLELYKVHKGSWSYPQPAWFKVAGVPLYSGFMYASVASYMIQAWRRLDLRLLGWPRPAVVVPFGAAIYLNFMTHHYIPDLRWVLTALLVPVFYRTFVEFEVSGAKYRMHLIVSFFLMGFFIWVAENIATFLGAWQYPNQSEGWSMVDWGKISSWFLLVIVSFMIVAQLKHVKNSRSSWKNEAPMAALED